MQRETLKAFLQDETLREILKANYNLKEEDIDNISMTSSEDIIELIIIKAMINKQADRLTPNIAASQITNLLDYRLT